MYNIYLHPTAIQPIAESEEYSAPRQEPSFSFFVHQRLLQLSSSFVS